MKKNFKRIFSLLMLGVMLYAPSAMALTCGFSGENLELRTDSKTILIDAQIPNTVHLVITILKIAIPVLLVVLGMIDLLKGITSAKEDEIKKGQQTFIKRLVAAVIVFFVVTIVQLVISFATGSNEEKTILNCADCFINGNCGNRE